jgi:DNA-binding NarL/FixJ family response regulator
VQTVIVSDTRFYAESLGRALEARESIEVSGTAAGAREGLRVAEEQRPDVVLLDTSIADGVWAARQLAETRPQTKIVALAVPAAEDHVVALVQAGVLGYVTREQSLDDIVATIDSVVREQVACSPKTAALVLKQVRTLTAGRPTQPALTAREVEILDLIARGLSNKEIAYELHIEVPTVKNHVHNILEKLQVRRRTAAVAQARLWSRPRLAPAAAPEPSSP